MDVARLVRLVVAERLVRLTDVLRDVVELVFVAMLVNRTDTPRDVVRVCDEECPSFVVSHSTMRHSPRWVSTMVPFTRLQKARIWSFVFSSAGHCDGAELAEDGADTAHWYTVQFSAYPQYNLPLPPAHKECATEF